ncbi:MAG: bifunctional diaminohydroxyphosphoribosylaminopyrimidine deaminase/5-amino-6-(5-phosphoribosylamino)uracil reductase RibD [Leadbetterella sp.]
MSDLEKHKIYMLRALDLASLGIERVSPNPMVGSVITHKDKIVAESYHKKYGEGHAEVNAIVQLSDQSILQDCTLYVTLEPCSHYGKTPPCAELIIKHKIPRVVIGQQDPNPLVAGKGIERLQEQGIEVVLGVLEEECKYINRRFNKRMVSNLPYVILKWAETADGFVDGGEENPLKITSASADILVHKWRSEEDAIWVGTGTVNKDNPRLDVRHWPEGKNPQRVIFGDDLEISDRLHVFDHKTPTYWYNSKHAIEEHNLVCIQVDNTRDPLADILKDLSNRGIQSILVEGGPTTHESFIKAGFFDEIRVIKTKKVISEGIPAANIPAGAKLKERSLIDTDEISIFFK